MIGNPCKWFITGYDQKGFTYEGGNLLYNFQPYDCELSSTMEMNMVFLANSKEHAKDVLERMLRFALACLDEYDEYFKDQPHYRISKLHKRQRYTNLLDNMDQWIFELAPVNQFYVVGWSGGGTI